MKKIKILLIAILCFILCTAAIGCRTTDTGDDGDWDNLGGGGTGTVPVSEDTATAETGLSDNVNDILNGITGGQEGQTFDENSGTVIDAGSSVTISAAGSYLISGAINGTIKVKAADVVLFFNNCSIASADSKVIDSSYDLIINLVAGTANTISNLGGGDKNAVSCSGNLTINGSGSLTINSTKSGIKCDKIFYGLDGAVVINAGSAHGISADACIIKGISVMVASAAKDGIHAETDDAVLIADPTFDSSRGFVYVGEGSVINTTDIYGDGIQADTFVLIEGGTVNIETNPTFITATSKDGCYKLSGGVYSRVAAENISSYSGYYQLASSNKGIKVGEIDYDVVADTTTTHTITNGDYTILIKGGIVTTATTDDGLHTNSGNIFISGGKINISSSDDGAGADKALKISGGTINITKSYEGLEGETIEISGGTIYITATDDGINAANSLLSATAQKTACYIIISGGKTYVNSSGDGMDSNGSTLISGGEVYISGPSSSGDAAMDSETGIIITGGIVVAIGSSGMVETPSTNSTQYCISINLTSSSTGAVTVKSGDNVLMSFSPNAIWGTSKAYQSVVISCPSFSNGSTYSVITGTVTTSAKVSSIITKIGTLSNGGSKNK